MDTCMANVKPLKQLRLGLTSFAYRYEGLRRSDFDEAGVRFKEDQSTKESKSD